MACNAALLVRTRSSIFKERRVACYAVVLIMDWEYVEIGFFYNYSISKWRQFYILLCLNHRTIVNVYTRNVSRRKTLRHHKGNKSRSCPDVEDTAAAIGKRTKQYTIRTNFHGTEFVMHCELLKSEIIV